VDLRAKIGQHVYIIGKCTLLMNSQIFNWTNEVWLREKLPLGSSGSKILATSESS
jgi:hypothetical protein